MSLDFEQDRLFSVNIIDMLVEFQSKRGLRNVSEIDNDFAGGFLAVYEEPKE
jgi:hypothetical protein